MLGLQPYERIQSLDRSGGTIEMFFSTAIYKYNRGSALHGGCIFCDKDLSASALNGHVTFQCRPKDELAKYVANPLTIDDHLSNGTRGIHRSYFVCRECFENKIGHKFQIVPIV